MKVLIFHILAKTYSLSYFSTRLSLGVAWPGHAPWSRGSSLCPWNKPPSYLLQALALSPLPTYRVFFLDCWPFVIPQTSAWPMPMRTAPYPPTRDTLHHRPAYLPSWFLTISSPLAHGASYRPYRVLSCGYVTWKSMWVTFKRYLTWFLTFPICEIRKP